MMSFLELSPSRIRYLRLRAQRLHPSSAPSKSRPGETVAHAFGIQAQEAPSAALAIWARDKAITTAQVEAARLERRSFVRAWCFRGTLYLLAAEDVGWLLSVFGPVFIRKSQRRYKQLGLTESICARAEGVIAAAIRQHGPLGRSGLSAHLAAAGIPVEGQTIYYLLRHAGLVGLICYGPEIDGEAAYVLLEDWLPAGVKYAEQQVYQEIVRRYLKAHGPARLEDIVSWTGLSTREIRAGIEEIRADLVAVQIDGQPGWMHPDQAGWLEQGLSERASLSLLPGYDPYLLGYSSRELIVSDRFARRIHPGGGLIRPTLIEGGLALATWKTKSKKDRLEILIDPFESLGDDTLAALEQECSALGHFYEQTTLLKVLD